MARLSDELLASAQEADERAEDYRRDGDPEGYEAALSLAASLRRLAGTHAASDNDPEQFAGRATKDIARELDITPGRVRQLARAHGIGIRVGRDWRFTGNDVAALRARIRPKRTETAPAPKSERRREERPESADVEEG